MRRTIAAAALLVGAAGPLQAEQSQAYFSQAIDICLAFGSDGFFVVDRLEEKGWTARYDEEYGTTVLRTPGQSVWVVPPPEGASMPAHCTVISGSVGIIQAEGAARFVLSDTNTSYREGTVAGCTAFKTDAGTELRIFSDGQDDFCNDPNSARVDVVTFTNPVGNQ